MQIRIGVPIVVAVLVSCAVARAEQFVLADVTYTHSTETTSDSHYYPTLPANTPDDWTAPVNYAGGSVHIVLDVMSKPAGAAPTKLQICFEGTPSYACTLQSPTYTTTGRVEWDSPFADFWYESTVDWSQGTMKMPLILKDDMNNKPHGNPQYMPTDLRVQVTLVSAGETFVPPPTGGTGGSGGAAAGSGGSGGEDGGAGGAGGAASGSAGASAGAGGMAAAGSGGGSGGATSPRPMAGAGGVGAQAQGGSSGSIAGGGSVPAANAGSGAAGSPGASRRDAGTGCRTARSDGGGGAWLLVATTAYVALRRRRRSDPRASV
jgi:hypothetical protein